MALYHQAAFTVDAGTPVPDVVAPAVGMDETGAADEFLDASGQWHEAIAGPLGLSCEDVGLTLTATVEGADDASRLTLDWGDGTSDELRGPSASHTYSGSMQVNVTATALIDQATYQVAKMRQMVAPGELPPPLPPDPE